MKNFDKYFESIVIPGIKIDDFIKNLQDSDDTYKNILATYYNTYDKYIDYEDKSKHIFKVNDLTGDILKNNRVVFKCMIFQNSELNENVKENITLLSLQEFYSNIPNNINIFGLDIKPLSFINKEDLEFTIRETMTLEEIIKIISKVSGYIYDGEIDGYHIFNNKNL
jgi:hypothetical protein